MADMRSPVKVDTHISQTINIYFSGGAAKQVHKVLRTFNSYVLEINGLSVQGTLRVDIAGCPIINNPLTVYIIKYQHVLKNVFYILLIINL
jgi:hypothetical protein